MKLTKDECIIMAAAINDWKFRIADEYIESPFFNKLEELQLKLENAGEDNRRKGRKSLNDFNDIVKRFCKK